MSACLAARMARPVVLAPTRLNTRTSSSGVRARSACCVAATRCDHDDHHAETGDEPLEGPLRDEKKRGSWTVALDIAVLATTSLRIRLLHFFVPQENGFSGGVSHGSKLAAFVEVSPDDC